MKILNRRYTVTHNVKGFTFVEILVAIATISIIATIISGSYVAGTRIKAEQEDVVEIQQNIRVALYLLAKDLRMAGYEIETNWDPSLLKTANIVSEAVAGEKQTINFSYVVSDNRLDVNGDGDPDTGQRANLSYYIAFNAETQRNELIRDDGENQIPVAENIDFIGFTYQNNAGGWTAAPPAIPSNTRAVAITIIARSSRIDKNLPAVAQTYTDRFITPPPIIYTSPADKFKRRVGTMAVSLRNFGI